jgi:glutamate decarboxylase
MPPDAQEVAVLRVVVREGFDGELASLLVQHLTEVVAHLEQHGGTEPNRSGFSHT